MDLIVGIDLGTTNSEVAYLEGTQPRVVPDESGDPILPSFVGLSDDGRLLVGRAARNQWLHAPDRTVKSIKRKMGQDVKVRLGKQDYTPQEISAMILRTLRDRAARHLGREIQKAVITVPAYFKDAERQATREAGELAGLEVVRILNEPTAASLAYDAGQSGLKRVLVYDLGGGTFDVSIVQMEDGVIEVLASHGDTQLGGDDFDALFCDFMLGRFRDKQGLDLRDDPIARARVLRAAEEAKKRLSFEPFASVQEEFIAERSSRPLHLALEVARGEFEDLVRPLLEKTIECVGRALDDAHLTPSQLDKVLLVGGSTRSPIVAELLQKRLGQPAHQEVHPDLCVALGAGIQGGIIAGLDAGPVLVDITPHSLGMRCIGDLHGMPSRNVFSRIIHRNTALPASRSQVYLTVYDSQETVDVEVYQGEHDDVRGNARIGNFRITGLAKVPAGNQVVAQMNLSLDGMLDVKATEKATGLSMQVRIENALSQFQRDDRDAARERIDAMFDEAEDIDVAIVPPGDGDHTDTDASFRVVPRGGDAAAIPPHEAAPHELGRSIVQAQALIEQGERLLDAASEADRTEIRRRISRLRDAVNERATTEIDSQSAELADLLFYIQEGQSE